jgi:hypothetical protein
MKIDKLAVWLNTIGYTSARLVAFAPRPEALVAIQVAPGGGELLTPADGEILRRLAPRK